MRGTETNEDEILRNALSKLPEDIRTQIAKQALARHPEGGTYYASSQAVTEIENFKAGCRVGFVEGAVWLLELLQSSSESVYEYGYTSKWGFVKCDSLEEATKRAEALHSSIEQGRESGDLDYHGFVVRRTKEMPGKWEKI